MPSLPVSWEVKSLKLVLLCMMPCNMSQSCKMHDKGRLDSHQSSLCHVVMHNGMFKALI